MADAVETSTKTDNPNWLTDTNGNRCSVRHFGSQGAAQTALDSLADCTNCTNCTDCSGCSRCTDCTGCSRCTDCSRCSGCLGCLGCLRCTDCSGCTDCTDCTDCSGCTNCTDCSGCSRCTNCTNCTNCSDCLRCTDCTDLWGKQGLVADASAQGSGGAPEVPVIADIHATVLAAVSAPRALDMLSWHTCNTTHCRAGWVVHLAGEAGYALEHFHDTALAAQLIYRASNPALPVSPVRFYETNAQALADMKAMAERESAFDDKARS